MSKFKKYLLPDGVTFIRNRKKKEKFDGVDPSLKPRHRPYRRSRKSSISEDDNG